MNMKKIPELLAPAGTLDAFKTAVLYGADAIYAGLPGFSMRARAKIDVEGVRQGIEFAQSKGKKVYLAFNLFAHDTDFQNMPRVREIIESNEFKNAIRNGIGRKHTYGCGLLTVMPC